MVNANGHSGGIAMLWLEQSMGKITSFSNHHIDLEVQLSDYPLFRLTGFYGDPSRLQRARSWTRIRNLAASSSLPWCIFGDMNNILSQVEKKGGRPYPNYLISGFQEVVAIVI